MSENKVCITVSQLNNYLDRKFKKDKNLKQLAIKGEVSNFTCAKSGHLYFSLKDENCAIRAIMFKGNASKLRFQINNGMSLIVIGRVELYPRDGVYQVYCQDIEPDGVGSLYVAFEQLREKLASKQYFNPNFKKEIPSFPENIGIVTSSTGAALQDILNILSRRYPLGNVTVFPTLVQGATSAQSIADNIKKAELVGNIDVLIVGRGGGSIEDLWSFNEEIVADAIFQCKIPVISAVGHETDTTIADWVADVRAPTPSAAAEIVALDINTIYDAVNGLQYQLDLVMSNKLENYSQYLRNLQNNLINNSPENKLNLLESNLQALSKQLDYLYTRKITAKEQQMINFASQLEALSPLKVLTRGYSITYDNDENIITNATQVSSGDRITTKFTDSQITSIVE